MVSRVAVIDADILLYKACRLAEEEVDWGDDQWVLWSDLNVVKEIFDTQVDTIVDEMGADRTILCFSDTQNYRKKINPEYKANRRGGRKPLCFKQALQYCKDSYPYKMFDGLEADDVIGIIATTENENEYVVVSEDKDLLTVPGIHWDLAEKKIYRISEEDADYNFFFQTLVGDPIDNYKGCPKVGKVTAERILSTARKEKKDLWKTVVMEFKNVGMTKKDAVINARMARILRSNEYNLRTGKIELWK